MEIPQVSISSIDRVVLINDFAKVRGGAAALVVLLAEQLARLKVKVTLISGDDGLSPERVSEGIEVVSLREPPLLARQAGVAFTKGLYNPSAAHLLSNWISRNDTARTVYHLHNWSHIFSASIFGALRRVGDRTVMHAHDYFLVCPNGAFNNYQTAEVCSLSPLSARCLSTNCDKRNYAQKLWRVARQTTVRTLWDFEAYQTNILLLHEGMQEPFVRSGIARSQLHTVRNPSIPFTDARVEAETNSEFAFIGRVDEEKGAIDFLDAAREAGVPARIIGEGEKLGELQRRFPEASFDGWRSHREISETLSSARMLVVPSRYPEPFGLVITEALSSGIPVILPNTALLKAEVTERKIGIGCNTRVRSELSAILKSMAQDNAGIEAMSREAFRLREMLAISPEIWSQQIVTHYLNVLNRHDPK
jgi:glycosyltransferase involved in cell wall biosynthesis